MNAIFLAVIIVLIAYFILKIFFTTNTAARILGAISMSIIIGGLVTILGLLMIMMFGNWDAYHDKFSNFTLPLTFWIKDLIDTKLSSSGIGWAFIYPLLLPLAITEATILIPILHFHWMFIFTHSFGAWLWLSFFSEIFGLFDGRPINKSQHTR